MIRISQERCGQIGNIVCKNFNPTYGEFKLINTNMVIYQYLPSKKLYNIVIVKKIKYIFTKCKFFVPVTCICAYKKVD